MAFTPVMLAFVGPASLSEASAKSSRENGAEDGKKSVSPSDQKRESLTITTTKASVQQKSVELPVKPQADTENPSKQSENSQA